MKKFIKIFSILLGTVFSLFLLAVIILPFVINPNHYKDRIQTEVAAQTDREFLIGGTIEWQVFPSLGLKLHEVKLKDNKDFSQDDLASVETAEISLKLMPLFSGDFEFNRLALIGLELNIVKNPDDEINLVAVLDNISGEKPAATQSPSRQQDKKSKETKKPKAPAIAIEEIVIKNGSLHWIDKKNNQTITIDKVNFNSQDIDLRHSFPIELGFELQSNEPNLKATFSLKTALQLDVAEREFAVKKLHATTQLQGDTLFPKGETLAIRVENISTNGPKQSAHIEGLTIEFADFKLQGKLEGTNKNGYSGALEVGNFNAVQLLKRLDPKLLNNIGRGAYEKTGFQLSFSGTEKQLSIDNLALTLDKSTLSGQALLAMPPKPRLDFDLSLNEIDLDNYLGEKSKAPQKDNAKTNSQTAAKATEHNNNNNELFDYLRALEMNGRLSIQRIKANELVAGRIQAKAFASGGNFRLAPLTALLYEGQYNGQFIADFNEENPSWRTKHELSHINLGDLLKDYKDIHRVNGYLDLTTQLQGQGLSAEKALPELTGTAKLHLSNGYFEGIDLAHQWDKAQQLLDKNKEVAPDEGRTDIADLQGSFTIDQGIASNNDLIIYNRAIYAQGAGQFNLIEQTLDYRLTTYQSQRRRDANDQWQYSQRGAGIPLRFSGPFTAPKTQVDLKDLSQEALKEAGTRLLDRFADEISDGDKEGQEQNPLGDLLKGLLGR